MDFMDLKKKKMHEIGKTSDGKRGEVLEMKRCMWTCSKQCMHACMHEILN